MVSWPTEDLLSTENVKRNSSTVVESLKARSFQDRGLTGSNDFSFKVFRPTERYTKAILAIVNSAAISHYCAEKLSGDPVQHFSLDTKLGHKSLTLAPSIIFAMTTVQPKLIPRLGLGLLNSSLERGM